MRDARGGDVSVLAVTLIAIAAAQPTELKLGIFMPWENTPFSMGPFISPAIPVVFDEINSRSDVLPHTTLKWVWHDDFLCDATQARAAMLDMKLAFEVDGFIGPPCSGAMFAVAPVGQYWNTTFISYLAASTLLSDKVLYPNVARVIANDASGVTLMLDFARQQGWDTLAVVYTETDTIVATGDFIVARINESPDVDLGFTLKFADTWGANANSTMLWMPSLRASGNRIVLVVGTCYDVRSVLLAAKRLDMLVGYQYLLFAKGEATTCHSVEFPGFSAGWGPEANEEAAHAFNNTLKSAVEGYESAEAAAFVAALAGGFRAGAFEPYRFPPSGTITPVRNVTKNRFGLAYSSRSESIALVYAYASFSRHLRDAVHLYARAAHAVIREGKDPSVHPEEIARMLPHVNFTGLTGFVAVDENLDRNPDVLLLQVREAPDDLLSSTRVGAYDAEAKSYKADPGAVIYYPGGTTTRPAAFVLRDCAYADYEVAVAAECSDDMQLPLRFSLKAGRDCQDMRPEASVPCAYVPVSSGTGLTVTVIASIAIAVAVACAAWVLVFRRESIVVFAQPLFCLLFLAGCALLNVSSLLRVGRDITVACVVSPCVFHVSFTLSFSALLAKTYRVWKIFINDKLQRRSVQASNVAQVCAFFVVVDAAILTAMVLRADVGSETITEGVHGSSAKVEHTVCRNAGSLEYLLWVMKAFVMTATCALEWQLRDVDEKFAESKHIMIAAYQATVLCAIAGMVTVAAETLSLEVLVQAFTTAIATLGSIVAIFGPKISSLHGWTVYGLGSSAMALAKPMSLAVSNGKLHRSKTASSAGQPDRAHCVVVKGSSHSRVSSATAGRVVPAACTPSKSTQKGDAEPGARWATLVSPSGNTSAHANATQGHG